MGFETNVKVIEKVVETPIFKEVEVEKPVFKEVFVDVPVYKKVEIEDQRLRQSR